MKAWIIGAFIAAGAGTAQAQVGHAPDRSPYRDREYNRDWTFFAGPFSGEKDPVGVAPASGPMAGVRWQMYMTGPMYFAVRLAGASVERTIIDPTKVIAERVVGTEKVPLMFADAQIELSLTGHKTWHGVAPFIDGGLGFVADVRGANDVGDYRFGIPFTMTVGTGLVWSVGRSWSLRLDWSHFVYRISYPASYYLKNTADPAVLPVGAARSFWRRNPALQLGISLYRPR